MELSQDSKTNKDFHDKDFYDIKISMIVKMLNFV